MPAAYLFDMDGLLLDTEQMYLSSFVECGPEFGLSSEASHDLYMQVVGLSGTQSIVRMEEILAPAISVADFDTRVVEILKEKMRSNMPLRPTVEDTLKSLSKSKAQMAVVTSTRGAAARSHLEQAGILHFFDFVVGGDEVSANKPNPAPYLEAAARFGFAPEICAAFEDSDPGVTAASLAGCLSVQIPDVRPANKSLPDVGQLVAASLKEAVDLAQVAMQKRRTANQVAV